MSKQLARLFSYLFHPIFVISYFLLILILVNPIAFGYGSKTTDLLVISVVALTVGFPMLVIFMLRGLGMIESIEMKDPTERIGPLIATGLFYLWLFVNIKNNPNVPLAFSMMVLGSTIGLFVGFFLNNFFKISLHSIGAGGIATAMIVLKVFFSYEYFSVQLGALGNYNIKVDLLLFLSIIISGLIGTCRLYLGAHKSPEVLIGYLVGIISQLIALRILI